MTDFLIRPSVNNKSLFKFKSSLDENGKKIQIPIIEEKPLTLYLNSQEIVTMMTIGDYPEYLALGYLYNQGMLSDSRSGGGLFQSQRWSFLRRKSAEAQYQ